MPAPPGNGSHPQPGRPRDGRDDRLPTIPGFEVTRKLGSGGMSVVYLARQLDPDRPVALKVLRAAGLMAGEGAARFAEEARIVARLRHRDIVQLYAVGEAHGLSYLVLEYVPGPTLARYGDGKPQDPRAAARMIELVARAVQYAHDQGVVHRDLKPGNILLKKGEGGGGKAEEEEPVESTAHLPPSAFLPKVTDFGLAKAMADSPVMTQSGIAVGTPGYMAPEQATGDRDHVGPWTDVYALGVILFELLTGRIPFPDSDPVAAMLATRSQAPPPPRKLRPSVPRDLNAICLKCLEKRPEDRYLTAADLANDLRRFLDDRPTLARKSGPVGLSVALVRRTPTAAAAVAAGLVAFGIGIGVMATVYRGPADAKPDPAAVAQAEADRLVQEAAASKGDTTQTWAELSVLMGSAGMGADAVEVATRRAAAAEKLTGARSAAAIEAKRELGQVYATLGRWPDADAVLARAWADAIDGLGSDHPTTLKIVAAFRAARVRVGAAAVVGGVTLLPAALDRKRQGI